DNRERTRPLGRHHSAAAKGCRHWAGEVRGRGRDGGRRHHHGGRVGARRVVQRRGRTHVRLLGRRDNGQKRRTASERGRGGFVNPFLHAFRCKTRRINRRAARGFGTAQ